jgi:hypothetical protein
MRHRLAISKTQSEAQMSRGPFPSPEAWIADKESEIAARVARLESESDPKRRRRLENAIARYRALITLGPEGASNAAHRAAGTRAG